MEGHDEQGPRIHHVRHLQKIVAIQAGGESTIERFTGHL